jgi:hypothetical protein
MFMTISKNEKLPADGIEEGNLDGDSGEPGQVDPGQPHQVLHPPLQHPYTYSKLDKNALILDTLLPS